MRTNRPAIALSKPFNILLIAVGVVMFLLFYIVSQVNFLTSLMIAIAPIIIGLKNLKFIRKLKNDADGTRE